MIRTKFILCFLLLAAFALGGTPIKQGERIDEAGIKTMLTNLGFEVKEPGAGVLEVPMDADGIKAQMRIYISKARTKIWMSVTLLSKDSTDKLSRNDLMQLLESNVEIGAAQFMVEKGQLKIKMPLDNRGVTSKILNDDLEYLAARIVDTRAVWKR